MTDPEIIKERMKREFLPDPDLETDLRVANAVEHMAFRLQSIDERLAIIQAIMLNPDR